MCECLEPCVAALSEAFCAGAGSQYSKKNDDYGRRRAAARTLIATVLPYQLESHQLAPQLAPTLSGLNYRRNYVQTLPNARPYNAHTQYNYQRVADGKVLPPSSLFPVHNPSQNPTPGHVSFISNNPDALVSIPGSTHNDIEAQHGLVDTHYGSHPVGFFVDGPDMHDYEGAPLLGEEGYINDSSTSPIRTERVKRSNFTQAAASPEDSDTSTQTLGDEKQAIPGVNNWGEPLVITKPLQPAAAVKPLSRTASKAPATPHPPKHVEAAFGQLMFGQIIGEGGFGKVYYGSWRGQTCAIKLMNYEAGMRSNMVEEFRREVTTMSSLTPHPNILRLLGACTKPPTLALVTEYCSRGSLYAMLHSPTTYLSWSQIVHMCLGAAHGMAHLHANRILHRDLKSGNLLVDFHFNVKVADFGLSKFYLDMQTMTGGLGTYQWMAPEVLANQRYSEKADVYSFGIVLWECSARQVPYAGMNGLQAALAVMNKGHRPEIPRHTPRSLAELISLCWAPIPEQRPSFVEIIGRLEQFDEELRQIAESGDFPENA